MNDSKERGNESRSRGFSHHMYGRLFSSVNRPIYPQESNDCRSFSGGGANLAREIRASQRLVRWLEGMNRFGRGGRVGRQRYCRFSRGFDGAVAMLRGCNSDWLYSNERGKHLKEKLVGIHIYISWYADSLLSKNMDNPCIIIRVLSVLIHIYSTNTGSCLSKIKRASVTSGVSRNEYQYSLNRIEF